MEAKQLIQSALKMSSGVWSAYLEDMNNDEIFMRPAERAKHVAWQIGHLISTQNNLMSLLGAGNIPELPEGFGEKHSKETADDDSQANFYSREEYLDLFQKHHQALQEFIGQMADSDLDNESPEPWNSFAPKVGDALLMMASHDMMHSGQVAVLRRKLDKAIVV